MRNRFWIGALVLIVAVAVPAVAGCQEGHEATTASNEEAHANGHANGHADKCSAETQVCLNTMASKLKNKGWVGVELDSNEELGGYTITAVEPDSPALRSGLKKGDVLLAMNGVRLGAENETALKAVKTEMVPGKTVTYTISRYGKEKDVDVVLAQLPDAVMAKWIGRHMMDHASIELAQN